MDPNELLAVLKQYGMSGDSAAGVANASGLPNSFGNAVGLKPLEFGLNMPTAQFGLQGLQSLAGMWNAFQAGSAAKKSINLQEKAFDTNLGNQVASYNTALENKVRNAAHMQGLSGNDYSSYIDSYLQKHALRKDGQVRNGATGM